MTYFRRSAHQPRPAYDVHHILRRLLLEPCTKRKREGLTNDELVARFVEVGVAQDDALLGREIGKYNKLFDEIGRNREFLRARPDEQDGS